MKKYILPFISAILLVLQSCSVDTKTTYYRDAATAMQSDISVDRSMAFLMSLSPDDAKLPYIQGLTSEWKSLYDLQKNGKLTLNADSAQVLKKLFLKLNKINGQTTGVSLKYDKLMPQEVAKLFAQNKKLRQIPLQDIASWDGKTLTVDTDKFSRTGNLAEILKDDSPKNAPATKQDSIAEYGRQMAQGAAGLMKMFNMKYSNTLKFQNPIRKITGKSDFVTQLDAHTVQIIVNTRELFDENKKAADKGGKIMIETE